MKIIFSNAHFVVIDKQAGYLSVPSRFSDHETEKDDRPVAGRILQEQLGEVLFPVHRLDFEVSGLLLFAKNKKAHRVANAWFENKKINKTYAALASANGQDLSASFLEVGEKFEWSGLLLRGKKRAYESPAGKPSLTHAQLIGIHDTRYLWHLQPVTGRPHQLRWEMARHGFPILGDVLYGSTMPWPSGGIALRAFCLEFPIDTPELSEFGLPEKILLPDQFS